MKDDVTLKVDTTSERVTIATLPDEAVLSLMGGQEGDGSPDLIVVWRDDDSDADDESDDEAKTDGRLLRYRLVPETA